MKVQALNAGYPPRTILQDISLSVNTGQFICIIAPNGAGKSTLLKTIAGILPPLQGEVWLNGKPLDSYSRRELATQIAVVGSEITALEYTAWQIVLMGRFPHLGRLSPATAKDYALVTKAMQETGIWHKKDFPCNKLSQGEQQKVIIARALAQQPKVLLLDEPTAHLDVCNQYAVLHMIKQLSLHKHLGVVAVIHDVNLALEFSTHLLLLKGGETLAFGRPQEILSAALLKELYGMDFSLFYEEDTVYIKPKLVNH